MPVTASYPGVYLEELPSGVKGIVGVSTSITAFVGYFARGPVNTAVTIYNFGDFQRYFGGLNESSETSYAVSQYFTNGGGVAVISRVAVPDAATASISIAAPPTTAGSSSYGAAVVKVSAANPGAWGNNVFVTVDYNTSNPSSLFNLTATEWGYVNGQLSSLSTTVLQAVTMAPSGGGTAVPTLQSMTNPLIQLTPLVTNGANPAPSGAVGTALTTASAQSLSGKALTVAVGPPGAPAQSQTTYNMTLGTITSVADVAPALQTAMLANQGLADAQVTLVGSAVQVILASPANAGMITTWSGNAASILGLATSNLQAYVLGSTVAAGAQSAGVAGADGTSPPSSSALIGSMPSRTGIYALDPVDMFNILCVPDLFNMTQSNAGPVITAATNYCMGRKAFMIVDMPSTVTTVEGAQAWILQAPTYAPPSAGGAYSASYFPAVQIPDPLSGYQLRTSAPSGTLAGVYAVTDASRGVWKAPAGVPASLRGVTSFAYQMNDAQNGALNPLGLNTLRTLPVYGNLSWGARTLAGADQMQSDWKYVPVRRLALFIENSLVRGLQWVVFEPNGEVLWSQIRLNCSVFMQGLFLKGAFAGMTPVDAYFVQCDASTTSAQDQANGIVNILVGFAPVRPAEFVIISLQQMAGEAAT